jgi:NitT/TauT family transport system ATP-binding protein
MKQRVGFARALVVEPEVLFMDEPFSALDVLTAENLRGELLELWLDKMMPARAIFIVTHNIEEAVLLSDRIIVLGRNPARIHTDFQVELAQPRDRKSTRFIELVDHTYKALTRPKLDHELSLADGAAGNGERRKALVERAAGKYQMLPHARPGGIAGLLEILVDRGGRDDLYHLADELAMDADDLLPIIDAATLLDFIRLEEGDVDISPTGRAFADAGILTRKALFREAALSHVILLRQIGRALQAKADRALPDDFFYDILEEHFSEDEAQRQLNTAIHWGRYGEIFDYDAGSGRLFLTEL